MAPFDSLVSFERDTPVLRLNHGKDPRAKWVLWPVLTWRVVAPVPKERKLNLFQRAVLGLARAGVTQFVEISERLLIAPDLAGLVVLELQNMALVEHDGRPTARGLKMLDDIEEDPPDEARVGHVLSDPFSGKLWPRFLTGDLPVADVELNEDGWPVLLSGTAGDPWTDRTFSILPTSRDTISLARPSARDVLRAARRHRRQRDFDEVDDERDVPRLRRVSFVDDRPEPYLLALRVRRHESGDWMVDDPFGHGESVNLRARLEERLDTHNGLRPWLSPLVGSEGSEPTLGHLQAEAVWKVEERLTLAIRQHDNVRERLVAMQRALLEAELLDAPRDKLNDVLVKAQRTVERLLKVVFAPYAGPPTPYFEDLGRQHSHSVERIKRAAAEVGFQGVPPKLTSIRRQQVRDAERRKGSLRALLVLNLIVASWRDEHPLRSAAVQQPDLLGRLDALADARNRFGAHDSDTAARVDDVRRHAEAVFIAVDSLLLPH